jgi:hypothetical protein
MKKRMKQKRRELPRFQITILDRESKTSTWLQSHDLTLKQEMVSVYPRDNEMVPVLFAGPTRFTISGIQVSGKK